MDIYVHICYSAKESAFEAKSFIKKHREDIEAAYLDSPGITRVIMKDGITHYFMCDRIYEDWCRGRVYFIGNNKYKSGYILKGE